MEELKIGDIVRLKSGGVKMLIENTGQYPFMGIAGAGAKCVWQDEKGNHKQQVYAVTSLEKVKE